MSSVEFFNELIDIAHKTKIHSELSIRDNIIAFLNIAECNLGHKLSLEFKHHYDEGYDVGHKDGYNDGNNKGYVSGRKDGYDVGYDCGFAVAIGKANRNNVS